MSVLADMSSTINLLDSDDDDVEPIAPAKAATAASAAAASSSCSVDLTTPVMMRPSAAAAAASGGAAGLVVDLSSDTPIVIDFSGCIDLTDEDGPNDEALSAALQSTFDSATFKSSADDCVQVVGEKKPDDVCWKQRRDVHEFLKRAAGQLSVDTVEPNPHAKPGQPMYERFRLALGKVADKTIKLVFHGTPERNVDAIMREGLDPGRRRGQVYGAGEYFGTDAGTSLSYSQGGRSMIIFAVMLDASGITHHQVNGAVVGGEGATAAAATQGMADSAGPGMVVVNKSDHQLPLFSIRFSVKTGGTAQRLPLAPPPRPNHAYRAPPRARKTVKKKVRAAPVAPPAPKTSWTAAETQKLVEATRKAVLEKRKKKKEAAAALQAAAS